MSFNALRLLFRRDPDDDSDWNTEVNPSPSVLRQSAVVLFVSMMSLLTAIEMLYHVSTLVGGIPPSDSTQVAAAAVHSDSGSNDEERAGAGAGTGADSGSQSKLEHTHTAEAATSPTTPVSGSAAGTDSNADTFMKGILLALLVMIGITTVSVLRRVWLRMRGRPAPSDSRISQYLNQLAAFQRLGVGFGRGDRGATTGGDSDDDEQTGENNLRMTLAMLGRDFSPEDYEVLQQLDGDRNPHGHGGTSNIYVTRSLNLADP